MEKSKDLPRTPHHFPRQQTAAELKLVKRYAKKCKGDPLLGYENASKHGHHRSYGCFKKTARKLLQPEAKKRKKRKNKPYQRAEYPGQKMQIDVKYVPSYCVVNGEPMLDTPTFLIEILFQRGLTDTDFDGIIHSVKAI